MDKLKMQSKNLVDNNIEKIAQLFPNCITEGHNDEGELVKLVDFDLLKQELSKEIVEGNDERYTLNWAGKKQAILTANSPINATLRPCREESVDFDNTKNLYIEGDNLDVLKLLRETYLGKVKMIYIDPPYNTGNDFVYEDDFATSTEDYLHASKSYDEQGNRMFQNSDNNGRFHSDWLSMIYSRVKLSKDILSDDGVIFISIDDNEQENLKKVCNEIFGEQNFIGQIVWQTTQKNDPKFIATNHEYILCYVKNIETQVVCGKWRTKHPLVDEMMKEYYKLKEKYSSISDIQQHWTQIIKQEKYSALKHYKYVDLKAPYFAADISDPQRNGPKHDFVIHPITGLVCKAPAGGYSPRETEMRRRLENDEIHFGATHEFVVCYKKYLMTAEDRLNSVYYEDGRRTTKMLEDMIGKGIFEHPKSEILVKRLLSFTTSKDDIILDFFSGSATTAHSVLELNAEDNGNRRFILVQIPEICSGKSEAYKAGYKNICEIGKERIRRAGIQVKELNQLTAPNLDVGFRVLKLDSSCMKDVYYSPAEMNQNLLMQLEDNIKEDRTAEDLLFQVMLDMGVMLSSEIKVLDIQGKKAFNVNDGNLVCCFDKSLTDNVVTEIAKMNPLYAVFRDASMLTDSVAVNFDQIFETYSPTTTRKII